MRLWFILLFENIFVALKSFLPSVLCSTISNFSFKKNLCAFTMKSFSRLNRKKWKTWSRLLKVFKTVLQLRIPFQRLIWYLIVDKKCIDPLQTVGWGYCKNWLVLLIILLFDRFAISLQVYWFCFVGLQLSFDFCNWIQFNSKHDALCYLWFTLQVYYRFFEDLAHCLVLQHLFSFIQELFGTTWNYKY